MCCCFVKQSWTNWGICKYPKGPYLYQSQIWFGILNEGQYDFIKKKITAFFAFDLEQKVCLCAEAACVRRFLFFDPTILTGHRGKLGASAKEKVKVSVRAVRKRPEERARERER